MELEHIKNLLQLTWTFNSSNIIHSFTISEKETLTVTCLEGTFILHIADSQTGHSTYFSSIEEAAEFLHEKFTGTALINFLEKENVLHEKTNRHFWFSPKSILSPTERKRKSSS